jgi:exodeoxyribonuclease VII small subunit
MKETKKETPDNTFEEAVQKLEVAVKKLDEGSLSLEESLKIFEEGVRWSRECHQFLEKAEERVKIILKNEDGNYETKPFEADEN